MGRSRSQDGGQCLGLASLISVDVALSGNNYFYLARGLEGSPSCPHARSDTARCLLVLGGGFDGSYLVDSASSHMLVSKIKPCMSKYKQLYRETANGSLNQLSFI